MPPLIKVEQPKNVEPTLGEHGDQRVPVNQPSINRPEILRRVGDALAKHVRFVERDLSPLVESTLDVKALESNRESTAALSSRERRVIGN